MGFLKSLGAYAGFFVCKYSALIDQKNYSEVTWEGRAFKLS
jgi:hypothetical protein